jgi:hypothetical protein
MLNNPDPFKQKIIPCPHSASDEILLHLSPGHTEESAALKISELCKMARDAYQNDHVIKWSNITLKGTKFDKEYFDGNGIWNEEHQSNFYHTPTVAGEPSNVLRIDAERVDDLYESQAKRNPLEWPGDTPTSIKNFENCELQSVMCCWVSDRQANDNNGNCGTPYDEKCKDADPADNTDLCAVDFGRSKKDSSHVKGGFVIFNQDEEGPVHCHGFAWGEDEQEADYRYRANNLFYVSMVDHLHDRGYVRAVQGAPMCACVENMPIVTRADCTEIEAEEFYKFTFPALVSEQIKVSVEYVDLNFNACQASQNNNLERFYQRLLEEGRVSRAKYDKFRETIVGHNKCNDAIADVLFEKGYINEAPQHKGWTQLYGRGSMISTKVQNEKWENIRKFSLVRRVCQSCSRATHKDIVYKRITGKGEIDFKNLFLSNWFSNPFGDGKNFRGSDFDLFSSVENALNNLNPWTFCNYNDPGIGFPRDCGPTGFVPHEWNSMRRGGDMDFAYYLLTDPTAINQAPEYDGWTQLHGHGSYISTNIKSDEWENVEQYSLVRRVCKSCSRATHKDIIYKRYTNKGGIDFKDLFLSNWFSDPLDAGTNVLGSDFYLFSTVEDALNNTNPWTFCNYDDAGIGFPRDCGPTGYVPSEWNSLEKGGEKDYAYYLYTDPSYVPNTTFIPIIINPAPEYDGWTQLYGRGSMISTKTKDEKWENVTQFSLVRRVCKSCSRATHKDVIYKRIKKKGDIDFRDLFLSNWFSDPSGAGTNILGSDFNLFSTVEDALNNTNHWTFCNYNDPGIGFPRDCGPTGYVPSEWNSLNRGGEKDFAYYLYTGPTN